MPPERPPYSLLYPGQVLWHVYGDPYAATAFNPASPGRFAARQATPARSMYYAGTTPACALWETVLRNIVAVSPEQPVELPPLDPLHIARVSLTVECPILDLRAPAIRWLTGADARKLERLQASTVTPDYSTTHALAAELLAQYGDAHGIRWHSRQFGGESVVLLYSPPAASSALVSHQEYSLRSKIGLALIDDALSPVGLRRADFEGLARELAAELPRDDPED